MFPCNTKIQLTSISNCSSKRITLYLLIILFMVVILQIWILQSFADFVSNISSILIVTHRKIIIRSPANNGTKYILFWNRRRSPFSSDLSIVSIINNYSVKNCEFTNDRYLLEGDYKNFDAIIFNERDLTLKNKPERRTRSQLYIFSTVESASNYPACELFNDYFYNWTFTYRLDSTVPHTYFLVRNKTGDIVAPRIDAVWMNNTEPIRAEIKVILVQKKKAAAWIVSRCNTDSFRNEYLTKLQNHLHHFSLVIDVYGQCTQRKCDNDNCEEMIKNNYYFYMAFENSFSTDYVTEKVLHGYNNFAIPIVYGGANYSRFLPPHSYINARGLHPYHLASIMSDVFKNRALFETYFSWTNLYTISNFDYNAARDLCAALHGANENVPAIKKFRIWWNSFNGMKWCLSKAYWEEKSSLNIDGPYISPIR